MPKKTRKQKLLAKKRRITGGFQKTPQKENSPSILVPSPVSLPPPAKSVPVPTEDYKHITRSLFKISLFTAFAFILQGVLYFVLNKG